MDVYGIKKKQADGTETWLIALWSLWTQGPCTLGIFRRLHAYKEPLWRWPTIRCLSCCFDISSRIAGDDLDVKHHWNRQGECAGNSKNHSLFKSGNSIEHHATKHSDLSTFSVGFVRYGFKKRHTRDHQSQISPTSPQVVVFFVQNLDDLSGINKEMMRRSQSWSSLRGSMDEVEIRFDVDMAISLSGDDLSWCAKHQRIEGWW